MNAQCFNSTECNNEKKAVAVTVEPWDPAQIQPPEPRISQAAAHATWWQLVADPFSGNCSPLVRRHSFSCGAAPKTWPGDIRTPIGWPPCSSGQLWRATPALEQLVESAEDWIQMTSCSTFLCILHSCSEEHSPINSLHSDFFFSKSVSERTWSKVELPWTHPISFYIWENPSLWKVQWFVQGIAAAK